MLVSQSPNEPIHPMNIHCASDCARNGAGDKVVCREDSVLSLYQVTYVQIEEFWRLQVVETLLLYADSSSPRRIWHLPLLSTMFSEKD